MSHTHDHGHDHGHGPDHSHSKPDHGHSHDILDGPGSYKGREMPNFAHRDFSTRAYTIGIGGPVGCGKTALLLALCQHLRPFLSLGVVTNDIFTREDCEFLIRMKALPERRLRAVVTGGCPHAAVREDISPNLGALEELHAELGEYQRRLTEDDHDDDDDHDQNDEGDRQEERARRAEDRKNLIADPEGLGPDLLFVESGGDNLAANFSRELADYIIYVVDVSGGDKIPRKGGPGTTQSDLLIINKITIADAVGADLGIMERDAKRMRDNAGPTVLADIKTGIGLDAVAELIVADWLATSAPQARRWARKYGTLSAAVAGTTL